MTQARCFIILFWEYKVTWIVWKWLTIACEHVHSFRQEAATESCDLSVGFNNCFLIRSSNLFSYLNHLLTVQNSGSNRPFLISDHVTIGKIKNKIMQGRVTENKSGKVKKKNLQGELQTVAPWRATWQPLFSAVLISWCCRVIPILLVFSSIRTFFPFKTNTATVWQL